MRSMRLGLVAALVLLCLAPTVAAQDVPEPGDVVLLLCDTVGSAEAQARDLLPVCPREEPAAPALPDEDAAAAAPPAPADAQDVADDVVATAGDVAGDPPSAPSELLGLVERILAFLADLVRLPVDAALGVDAGFREVQDAIKGANAAIGDATARGASAVRDGIAAAAARVAALFDQAPADAPAIPDAKLPVRAPRADLPELPLGEVREMLAEG